MIIAMQGNWNVKFKSKSAAYKQRFIVSGAAWGNGTYDYDTYKDNTIGVGGDQWTIAIQNEPTGGSWQLSDTKLKFPRQIGGNYEFDIHSNDAGSDSDFNDLILTCSTPVNINDFIIYGNVSLYSGNCLFNPCRPYLHVIETPLALSEAMKNVTLREILMRDYRDRIPEEEEYPTPPIPDPEPFKPIVIDLFGQATMPRTELVYQRLESEKPKSRAKAKKSDDSDSYAKSNFSLINTVNMESSRAAMSAVSNVAAASILDGLRLKGCTVGSATNTTLTFEEYDRTAAELAGGPYTGTGNRRLLGDTITDMEGNYIFRFSFDMSFPGIEDSTDIAPGEDVNVVAYPDVIVKVTGFSPDTVLYESAPYRNIPNLKRINLCLPKSQIQPSSACFNGNLIGSLGNVFIGGNQNSAASFSSTALRRYGYGNELESTGVVSVGSSLAGFNIDCAPWYGRIDIKGCMYDLAKTVAQNKIKCYTIRIKRAGSAYDWQFVSQNYKHPKFHKRNLPGYIGDDVGPSLTSLKVDGGLEVSVPAYTNIQREIFVDGVDWEFSNFDRYMQLNTWLYDKVAGVRTPGKFYVRVDCYDDAGNPVPDATDMIALYIHNNPLSFELTKPVFNDPLIVNSGCGLFRLADTQLNEPMTLTFKANDPYGFVHSYRLSMARCPEPMIALQVNSPKPPLTDTLSGDTVLAEGVSASVPNTCSGFTGTIVDFSDAGMITVEIQPAASEGGWIKPAEYFTTLSFTLLAYKRQTNGYNTGVSDEYWRRKHIYMERINP
jgi:hypothetical protein